MAELLAGGDAISLMAIVGASELAKLVEHRSCIVDITPQSEGCRQQQRNIPNPGVFRVRLPEKLNGLVRMAQQQMAGAQTRIAINDILIARTELECLFEMRQRRFRLARLIQRIAELKHPRCEIAVERNSPFERDTRLD